jgi:hypothetical protein
MSKKYGPRYSTSDCIVAKIYTNENPLSKFFCKNQFALFTVECRILNFLFISLIFFKLSLFLCPSLLSVEQSHDLAPPPPPLLATVEKANLPLHREKKD